MSDPIVQEIKEKVDIAEVVGEYVQLRRAGINLKGLCPFHNEKSPSFMVNRERNSWHCFGCSEGGDVYSFLQKHEGLTFPEALKILADKAGVVLPQRTAFKKDEYDHEAKLRDELLQINELAARFYHEALLRSKAGVVAREYLAKRGLTEATIKKWQLGFAPDDWHILENFLVKKGWTRDLAIQAGLLVRGEKGKIYDRFRFRITFPFVDQYGRIVGFTSRALESQSSPSTNSGPAVKYINSPETAIYHKSRFLYGYYFAKHAIRDKGAAVVVEGNMDAISSHQAGVENVVASSGTALTADQLNLAGRLTKNLIFAFDADKAGLSATRRGVELALALGFSVRIARLPAAKDPDDLIKQDPKLWQKALDEAPNFLDFSFDLLFAKLQDSEKEKLKDAAHEYLQIVAYLSDTITQAQEARRVAEKLNVPVDAVLANIKKAKSPGIPSSSNESRVLPRVKTRRQLLEERILALSLVDPALQKQKEQILTPADFIISLNPSNEAGLQFLGEEELKRLREVYPDERKFEKSFNDLCKELKGLAIREQMQTLTRQMAELESRGKTEEFSVLRRSFQELSETLSQISKD